MATREFILTEHFDAFIEAGVSSGRFRDASELVREGLRLLEEQEARNRAKLEWLRSAVRKGIDELDRGEALEFGSIDEFEAYLEQAGKTPEPSKQANDCALAAAAIDRVEL